MAGLSLSGERVPRFEDGLLPVVVQSEDDGEVLMLGWANQQALARTLRTGKAHFWSRSRDALWRKGETSGNTMRVLSVAVDCDGDALLYRVEPAGPACHTGERSCFEQPGAGEAAQFSLHQLERIIAERAVAPAGESYTARLLARAPAKPAAKLVEEAGELAVAALAETKQDVAREAADVLYHFLVLLRSRKVSLASVIEELAARRMK
jgi:phosphoribosyl-AMP cyclohydrolase / phosphoribosyl-ATP pyrophosphohydrolase